MIYNIVIYPDKRLKLISKEVTSFDTQLQTLLDDMYDTMISKKGVGLAAIQIGIAKRMLIINIPIKDGNGEEGRERQPKENTLEIINPKIIELRGSAKHQEGCLSVPGVYENIERAEYIKVEYQDRYGNRHFIETDSYWNKGDSQ
jgi:peptide deformylase